MFSFQLSSIILQLCWSQQPYICSLLISPICLSLMHPILLKILLNHLLLREAQANYHHYPQLHANSLWAKATMNLTFHWTDPIWQDIWSSSPAHYLESPSKSGSRHSLASSNSSLQGTLVNSDIDIELPPVNFADLAQPLPSWQDSIPHSGATPWESVESDVSNAYTTGRWMVSHPLSFVLIQPHVDSF